jgi:hypothetical protein
MVALDGFKKSHAEQVNADGGLRALAGRRIRRACTRSWPAPSHAYRCSWRARCCAPSWRARPELVARWPPRQWKRCCCRRATSPCRCMPQDLPLVAAGAAEVLQARGARLVVHPAIEARRLPCRVRHGQHRRAASPRAGRRPPAAMGSELNPGTLPPKSRRSNDRAARPVPSARAGTAFLSRPAGLCRRSAAAGIRGHAGARDRPGAGSRRRAGSGGIGVRSAQPGPARRGRRGRGLRRRPRLPDAHRRGAWPGQRRQCRRAAAPQPAPRWGHENHPWRRSEDRGLHLPMGDGLLGRVVDSHGEPIDRQGPLHACARSRCCAVRSTPWTATRCASRWTPACAPSTPCSPWAAASASGLFAGTGVGKSVLLGMMARYTAADVIVVGLIGERGREVKEFIEDILGDDGRSAAWWWPRRPTRRRWCACRARPTPPPSPSTSATAASMCCC